MLAAWCAPSTRTWYMLRAPALGALAAETGRRNREAGRGTAPARHATSQSICQRQACVRCAPSVRAVCVTYAVCAACRRGWPWRALATGLAARARANARARRRATGAAPQHAPLLGAAAQARMRCQWCVPEPAKRRKRRSLPSLLPPPPSCRVHTSRRSGGARRRRQQRAARHAARACAKCRGSQPQAARVRGARV